MKSFFLKKIGLSMIAGLLALSFVCAPISQTMEVKRAEAWTDNFIFEMIGAGASLVSAAANSAAAAAQASLSLKEYALDPIAWFLVNTFIKALIRSVTTWVNSGFQGSPMFMQDMQAFLLGIADRIAGDFIWGSGLGFLCSPFKLNIQFALDLQYGSTRNGYKSNCSLSGVVNNMNNFIEGDFLEGGWNGWSNMALVRTNNPYGAMFEAEAALGVTIANAQGQKIQVASWGSGFLPKDKDGKTVTPGKVIETQLNESLGLPAQRLNVADEINELIGALFSQLVGAVLGGVGGLLGLTDESIEGGSYLSRVEAEQDPTSFEDDGTGVGAESTINTSIIDETEHIQDLQLVIDLITDASTYKRERYPDTDEDGDGIIDPNDCHTGALTTSLSRRLASSTEELALIQGTVMPELNVYLADHRLISATTTPSTTITALYEKYGVGSIAEVESKIMTEYLRYSTSGVLYSATQNAGYDFDVVRPLKDEVSEFKASIDSACQENGSGGG